MKNKRFLSAILSIIFVVALCVPAHAVESRASAQIAVYNMHVTPVSGAFSIYFSVTGAGIVDKLGCESIYVDQLIGGTWVSIPSKTLLENDSGMSSKNNYDHTNSIRCSSERGENYRIIITIFAENSAGRDTRTQTFYVTGQ